MFQNLINRFVAWFYNRLEAEKVRRIAVLRAELDAKRDEAQRKNAAYLLKMLREKQDRCTHLKGGKISSGYKDYAVMNHRFIDGRTVIKCLLCSKEWSLALGNWKEGYEFSMQSTNTMSASEGATDRSSFPTPISKDNLDEPLAPFVSNGYIKLWEKLEKKLARRKKGKK